MTTWLPNSRYHHCQEVSFFTVLRLGVGKSMGETLEANPGYLRQFLRNWIQRVKFRFADFSPHELAFFDPSCKVPFQLDSAETMA